MAFLGKKKKSKNRSTTTEKNLKAQSAKKQIRYAVVGLGYIAQIAVLPAFKNAKKNSRLVALVSDDEKKLTTLGKKYRIVLRSSYDEYDALVRSKDIDAVYIALPNSMHMDFAVRALENGKHVLCEKPLAVTSHECKMMMEAAERGNAKLMTAYRLHFEAANLQAMEIVKSGKIGTPRIFNSLFSFQIKEENIRLERRLGGGSVYDLGIYCINAARQVFQSEPEEVIATSAQNSDSRFSEVDEMTAATMVFPGGGLATFCSSFGAADSSMYEVIGTKGSLRMEPAYDYSEPLKMKVTVNGKTKEKKFKKMDQFAPELLYFSKCILEDREPEPSGREGLADVRIIQAIYESAKAGGTLRLADFQKKERPTMAQVIERPAIKEPKLIRVTGPAQEPPKTASSNGHLPDWDMQ